METYNGNKKQGTVMRNRGSSHATLRNVTYSVGVIAWAISGGVG